MKICFVHFHVYLDAGIVTNEIVPVVFKLLIMRFIFFLIFVPINLVGQVTRVNYNYYTKNTIDTTGINTYLLFDNEKSVYIFNSNTNKIEDHVNETPEFDIQIKRKIRDTVGFRVYNRYQTDTILVIEKINIEKYAYKDNYVMHWLVQNEFKKIGSYNCQLAKTSFRGRDYTVWFTKDIPVPIGPWKFRGLPGLIVEVNDSENEVHFSLKSIAFNQQIKSFFDHDFPDVEYISLKNYVKKRDDFGNELLKETLSKLPRGANGSGRIISISSRMGLEKIYEWEEDE